MVHRDTKKKLSKPSTNCTPVKSESLMHPGAPVKPNPMSFPVKVAMNSFPKEIYLYKTLERCCNCNPFTNILGENLPMVKTVTYS